MSGKLAAELRQSRPFASLEEEALLNLARTQEILQQKQAEFFREFHLTRIQYNVLRILRGAGDEGLPCNGIAERMVTADPDITRLLDRLESRQWILRERSRHDRRVVVARIAPAGVELLASIDQPLRDFILRLMGRPGQERLEQLIAILETLREE